MVERERTVQRIRGGARPGAGRPKGVPNKLRIIPSLKGEPMAMRQRYEVMPLDHMLKVINTVCVQKRDENDEQFAKRCEMHKIRQDAAARAAAPFMHYRLASIEVSGKDGEPIKHQVDLSRLSDDELVTLQRLTRKAELNADPLTIDNDDDYYVRIVNEEERALQERRDRGEDE